MTLDRGLTLLEEEFDQLRRGGKKVVAGDRVFQLYDTFGFPDDLTEIIAGEHGFGIDRAGYAAALEVARERSKFTGADADKIDDQYKQLAGELGATEFLGYSGRGVTGAGKVRAILAGGVRTQSAKVGAEIAFVCDRTPFYGAAGGQIGDTGTITTDTGVIEVLDTTFALPNLRRHLGRVAEGEVVVGQAAIAEIDSVRRDAIRRNHTATHLLHHALRKVLGDHVKQAGSMVGPDRLRFDFSHYEAVSAEQIAEIESLVNSETLANEPTRAYETTKDEAEALGAIAFFGDKYGDIVRVLEAGSSVELCGGTHVRATGDIGTVKVVSEASIGSNLRRIEAITGSASVELLQRDERLLTETARLLGSQTDDVLGGVQRKLDEIKSLTDEVKSLRGQLAVGRAGAIAADADAGSVVTRIDGLAPGDLRELAIAVRQQPDVDTVVLIGETPSGGVGLVAAVAPGSGRPASALISEAARAVGGGGGGKGDIATAGGKDASKIPEALAIASEAVGRSS
jgi:alanyl-tRNA synthetase